MTCIIVLQHVHDILEILDVTALVGTDRNTLRILLQRRLHDFRNRTVVGQVDDLDTQRLKNPPHDIDGGIMPVKQAGRSNKTEWG